MAEEDVATPEDETPAIEEVPEGQYVNGEFISNSELRDGYMRNATFTQKTQTLAEDRKAIEAEKASIAQIASDAEAKVALAAAKEVALAKDKAWYGSHPQEEWANYNPEIDALNNGATPVSVPQAPPADKETSARLDKIIKQNEDRDRVERQTALENRVDAVLAEVDRVRSADFPLADVDMVQAKIEAHQSLNGGKLPSNAEIRQFSKEVHDKFVKSGARVPKGVQTESSKADVTPGAAVNAGIGDKHTELDINKDPDSTERALKDYMASKLDAQES